MLWPRSTAPIIAHVLCWLNSTIYFLIFISNKLDTEDTLLPAHQRKVEERADIQCLELQIQKLPINYYINSESSKTDICIWNLWLLTFKCKFWGKQKGSASDMGLVCMACQHVAKHGVNENVFDQLRNLSPSLSFSGLPWISLHLYHLPTEPWSTRSISSHKRRKMPNHN